jgi:DNA-binding transcriptional ArsR family regulator
LGDDKALKDWIRSEMTLEKPDILLQVKDRVGRLLGVSKDGGVGFRLEAEQLAKLGVDDKILLYMIGKLYAQAAEYSEVDLVTNVELQRNLGMPEGTVRGKLTQLRTSGLVSSQKPGTHSIARNRVVEILAGIERKLEYKS